MGDKREILGKRAQICRIVGIRSRLCRPFCRLCVIFHERRETVQHGLHGVEIRRLVGRGMPQCRVVRIVFVCLAGFCDPCARTVDAVL